MAGVEFDPAPPWGDTLQVPDQSAGEMGAAGGYGARKTKNEMERAEKLLHH